MKRLSVFFWAVAMCVCLCACTNDSGSENPDDTVISIIANGENLSSTEEPENGPNGNITKQLLLDQYGGEFELCRSFGMELIRFKFDETSVTREHLDSMKDDVPTHTGTWDIIDGQLVVTGEWNEIFILDLDANIAISKTDGEEYRIPEKDDSLTKYGALQDVVLTYGFPIEIKVLDGMELTILTLNENHAHWELRSNQRPMQYDNLSWSVDGDCLSISGELIESFIIDIVSGTAVSQSTGIEYEIFVMKEDEASPLVE